MNCEACGAEIISGENHKCTGIISNRPIKVQTIHSDFAYEVKVSNDNTKGEKRVTVHVRSDHSPEAAQKLADKLYKDELGS